MIDTPRAASSTITREALELARRQARCRLVHRDDLAFSSSARAISTIWRCATFRVLICASGRIVGSSAASASAAAFSCSRCHEDGAAAQRTAEKHVLRDGQLAHLLQFLVDHGDPGPACVEGPRTVRLGRRRRSSRLFG